MALLKFNENVLLENLSIIKERCDALGVALSVMAKKELLSLPIHSILEGVKVYTTGENDWGYTNIYDKSEDVEIVDCFDYREGTRDISNKRNKKTAIVNFYCGNSKLPSRFDLERICKMLKEYYERVSFGGSFMLYNDFGGYDEVRVGEALLTGYSCIYKNAWRGLKNPFSLEYEVLNANNGTYIIKDGFLGVSGFTNAKVLSVCTDWTILENDRCLKTGDVVTLNPDYYSLMKKVNNNDF